MRRSLFGKRNNSNSQKVIKDGIIAVAVNLVILTVLFFVAGREIGNMIFGDFAYAVNTGAVVDDINAGNEVVVDNTVQNDIGKNEWVSPKSGTQYGYVVCEDIGLEAALYYGDSDSVLLKGAGQSVNSYFPGQNGTILIGAHDSTYFGPLSELEDNYSGKVIKLNTTYGVFEYEVTGQEIVKGSDFEIKNEKEQLVLYTCYPFEEISEERTEKILFYCDKISGPVIGGAEDE